MVRARALTTFMLLLAGCSAEPAEDAMPSPQEVDRVEAALARSPCVGDLNQWERNYRLSRKEGRFFTRSISADPNIVELHLRHAGTLAIQPGRSIYRPAPGREWPEVNGVRAVDGRFWLSNGSLQLQGCRRAR